MADEDGTDSNEATATLGDWRGPLRIHCKRCREFKRAPSVKIPLSIGEGKRRYYYVAEPDIAWFRRKRQCSACGAEFFTGEIDEGLIEELLRLRQREQRRRSKSYAKVSNDVRVRWKWLDTSGDDVPLDLAAELVRGSAWWLTHSSGSPVRAPRHADRLQKLYCGWSVEFGANWFAAGRALARARDYAKTVLAMAADGKMPSQVEIKRRLRAIPATCVLNANWDFYDDYPVNRAGELVFGAQAIDVDNCATVLMRVTGLDDLAAAYAKVDAEA